MSMYSGVISLATSILCNNRGSMEITELHQKVLKTQNISEADLWFMVCKCPRFAVVYGQPKGTNGESDCIIVAKTTLRLCMNYWKSKCTGCQDLHLCKFYLFSNCKYGRGRRKCEFSHDIHSQHNYPLLRECLLHQLSDDELFVLLLQNDPYLLPEVCLYYNKGNGNFGECYNKETCSRLHICQYFLQDKCSFEDRCKRIHGIDRRNRSMLENWGLVGEIVQDLLSIYKNAYRLKSQVLDVGPNSFSKPAFRTEDNEICLHFLRKNCRFQDKCNLFHFNKPYKWEFNDGDCWKDLPNQEEIEQAYSDPRNEQSPGPTPVNFISMKRNFDPVRRFSTASSVSKPKHYVLTTTWIWYYKGDHENWIEYGEPDDKNRVTSVTSEELERAFLQDATAEVTLIKGKRHYYVSFSDMYQRNPKHNTKRRVRRRPRFVSMRELELKVGQAQRDITKKLPCLN